jgi:endonuclease-8
MGHIGPDLCSSDTDLRRCALSVMRYHNPTAPIAEVVLDQRVMAGLGNVYRSEVLWGCKLNPWAPVGALVPAEVHRLVETAAQLVQVNLQTAERVTTVDVKGGLAVYGRVMQRCVRCGSIIEATKPGEFTRTVYWCPGCQTRHDPCANAPAARQREMDPHPAAVKYLNELPWRRVTRS